MHLVDFKNFVMFKHKDDGKELIIIGDYCFIGINSSVL